MNPTDPQDDEHRAMREALQRDAARLPDEPFDAALHYATMRRIRALGGAPRLLRDWPLAALGAACAATLVIGIVFVPKRPAPVQGAVTVSRPAQGSAWSYQRAARQGDEALLAALDRDARDFLQPAATPFSVPLH